MSRNSSGDPHPQLPSPSTATQLPPLSFKHCRSMISHSSYVSNQVNPHLNSQAYCSFHGGIGVGYQERQEKSVVSRRRPPLSQGGKPVPHHASSFGPFFQADSFKTPAGGLVQKTAATATGGTGVFIPVYCTRIVSIQDDDLNNNEGMEGEENQQKDYEEETPIEMLLPSEWTY